MVIMGQVMKHTMVFRIFLLASLTCSNSGASSIKRNPFLIPSKQYPDEVIATASVCGAAEEQISFVQVKGKIRCIKRKTPSTWES